SRGTHCPTAVRSRSETRPHPGGGESAAPQVGKLTEGLVVADACVAAAEVGPEEARLLVGDVCAAAHAAIAITTASGITLERDPAYRTSIVPPPKPRRQLRLAPLPRLPRRRPPPR